MKQLGLILDGTRHKECGNGDRHVEAKSKVQQM